MVVTAVVHGPVLLQRLLESSCLVQLVMSEWVRLEGQLYWEQISFLSSRLETLQELSRRIKATVAQWQLSLSGRADSLRARVVIDTIYTSGLSHHGCTSRAYHVTLSYQMLGMLGIHGYPACVLLDRLIIFIIHSYHTISQSTS